MSYYQYQHYEHEFKPTHEQLERIEAKIHQEFHEYLEHYITIPITSMLRMGYYPETLINELNQIKKLSMFKSDQCLRMLDNLLSYKGDGEE